MNRTQTAPFMHFFDCQSVITHMMNKIRILIPIFEKWYFWQSENRKLKKKPYCLTDKLVLLYTCIFFHSSILSLVLRKNVFLSRLEEKTHIPNF